MTLLELRSDYTQLYKIYVKRNLHRSMEATRMIDILKLLKGKATNENHIININEAIYECTERRKKRII